MEVLERETHLAELSAVLRDAAAGQGRVVLVTGEAGAGKTSLVRRHVADHNGAARVLWGLCDELVTPRPLGPFRDMFDWLGAPRGDALNPVVSDLLGSLVDELAAPPHPVVAVVEDAQWADMATLDAVRFIGRRVGRIPAVLIVTYRTDEVPADHALRVALGAIPSAVVRRLTLPRLSLQAVCRLAERADAHALYELTGGNPFYVQEVLAAPDAAVPATVQDAVMARIGHLADVARASAEVVAVLPAPAEPWLLDECGAMTGADEAVRAGVLRRFGDAVGYPHELARRAVRHSMPAGRWRLLNGQVLDILVAHDADPARLTHHAVEADRPDAIARYAPVAARRARELGSHAEAFQHYGRALERAGYFTDVELLDLFEAYAAAARSIGRWDEARTATVRAIEFCRESGDNVRLGRNLCVLGDVEWSAGRGALAHEAASDAIRVLEPEPAGDDLVTALSLSSKLAMVDHRTAEAVAWGERAISVARESGLSSPIDAMVTVGSCRLQVDGMDSGPLKAALEEALRHGDSHAAARAYVNLADELALYMKYDDARRYIDEGLEFVEAHDLLGAIDHMLGVRARWHLERGDWSQVERDRASSPGLEGTSVTMIELAVGLIQARRGDSTARRTLDGATRLASFGGDTQLVVPAALAHAECAWLAGDLAGTAAAVNPAMDRIIAAGLPRWVGEGALWLHRAGILDRIPDGAAEPYALQVAGDWEAAAECWARLGRPYDRADALADAPQPEPLFEALEVLDRFRAVPRAAMVRRRLAALGVESVPRGPRGVTLASPAGLTPRQTEVLGLLAEQLTYQEIAGRLQLSIKTVDRHVTAIRAKLGVGTRDDAVRVGRRLGILT